MVKILFTKELPATMRQELDEVARVEYFNILTIDLIQPQLLQIDFSVDKHLISSKNALHIIEKLPIKGDFYVVGNKSKQQLKEWNKNVLLCSHTANELANQIIKKVAPTTWNFYCGNNRRDELITKLRQANHKVNELVCYHSIVQEKKFDSSFDAIVLLSPLSAKTFFKNNQISLNTIIFTIGKTTTFEVRKYTTNTVIESGTPTIEEIIKEIKKLYGTNQ